MSKNRRFAVVSAVTTGLLATAFLPMAIAVADEYDFQPNIANFTPSQVEGYPPLIDVETGSETWKLVDLTTNTPYLVNAFGGTDTQTTFGSFTNDDYLTSTGLIANGTSVSFFVPAGSQIDLANFGLGFENEWIDVTSGSNPGMSDLFITPFGDFELLGSGFSDLSTALAP